MPTSPSSINPRPAAPKKSPLAAWIERNRPMLSLLLDAYCVVDPDNQVVDFNVAFTELCGYSFKRVRQIGHFCDLVSTERCPERCPAREVFVTEKPIRLDELAAATVAYPNLRLILGAIPATDEEGRAIGAVVTIRNVSAEAELQDKYDHRKRESVSDGLTGLFNKIFTEKALARLVRAAYRDGSPLSVVMCDIDHFKKVNDVHGHLAGDEVLRHIASLLKAAGRETDIMGRFGGEEMIAVLWNTDAAGALVFAERFRNAVMQASIPFADKIIPVTMSLGTATFHEAWTQAANPDDAARLLVERADHALYAAKHGGRNRTMQSETSAGEEAA